jgi:hypothetical protein
VLGPKSHRASNGCSTLTILGVMGLNNREWAALFWLIAALIWALSNQDIRRSAAAAARTALHPKISIPLILMLVYVGAMVYEGWRLRVWRAGLVKDTIIWFVGSALVLFVNLSKASQERHFYLRTALRTLQITVLIEFFINLFVLSFWAELLLQPLVVLLVLVSSVADRDRQYRSVKQLVDRTVEIVGFCLAAFSLTELVRHWGQLDKLEHGLQFALPVWLTVGLLPLIYLVSVYATYEVAFLRIDWATKDRTSRRRAKLALVITLLGRTRSLSTFAGSWAHQVGSAGSLRTAREIVRRFRTSQRLPRSGTEQDEDE